MISRNLKNVSKKDIAMTGGKGSRLGDMIKNGFSVPSGFVVLTSVFDDFLKESGLQQKISKELKSIDYKKTESVNSASKKIRGWIDAVQISSDIEKEIIHEFEKLNCKFAAVRSSATLEDSFKASWAGELDTFLNTTKKTLIVNVKKCWSSLYSARAIFYRKEKGLINKKIGVAVVIQEMVESEVSGIVFTVHPVTENKNQIIIEAGYGLGEAIVSGSITPDSYVVDKRSFSLIEKNISTQEKKMLRCLKEGVKWANVLKAKQKKQKLSNQAIIKLARICGSIERCYGKPQDIEFAFKDNEFYIVQSRPITTLI